jgi:hypothetical protein
MTLRYINRVLKSNDPSLVYSIKLSRLNIVWNVRVAVDSECIISRSTKRVSTYETESSMRLRKYSSDNSKLDLSNLL